MYSGGQSVLRLYIKLTRATASTVDGQSAPGGSPSSEPADLKFEAVVIPVADADRSKAFYAGLGWRLDADFSFDNGVRVVQFTPPGSLCSVQFGTHITGAPPGSAHGLCLIVSDIEAGTAIFTILWSAPQRRAPSSLGPDCLPTWLGHRIRSDVMNSRLPDPRLDLIYRSEASVGDPLVPRHYNRRSPRSSRLRPVDGQARFAVLTTRRGMIAAVTGIVETALRHVVVDAAVVLSVVGLSDVER